MISLILASLLAVAQGAGPSGNAPVTIEDVRVAFERKNEVVEAQELLFLRAREKLPEPHRRAFRLPLPAGARNATPVSEESSRGVEILGDEIAVDIPAETAEFMVSVKYDLPLEHGQVVFDQRLPYPVGRAHGISTWTIDGATLRGKGFGTAEEHVMGNGIQALLIVADELPDGHLQMRLSGLGALPGRRLAVLSLLLSMVALLTGVGLMLSRTRRAAVSADGKEK